MKSQNQMIEFIISKTIRQKVQDLSQPGTVLNILNQEINSIITQTLDNTLKSQQAEILDRLPYERKDKSPARNGYRLVHIPGIAGSLTLRKPVTRKGTIEFPLLTALKKAGKGLINVLAACFWLKGTSTRNTADILKTACGQRMSATTVSEITNALEPAVRAWETRPIPQDIIYVFLDALYLPVHWQSLGEDKGFVRKNALLAGLGVTSSGKTIVLGFLLGDRENQETWETFLKELKDRGVNVSGIRLVISDEHKAIIGAVGKVLGVPHQYCVFHKMNNVKYRVASPDRKGFLEDFKNVYWAGSREESQKASGILQGRWGTRYPKAVEIALANYDSFTMFMNEPKERWRSLRTSNRIERFNEELRRRLKPAGMIHSELELRKICWSVSEAEEASWSKRCSFGAKGGKTVQKDAA